MYILTRARGRFFRKQIGKSADNREDTGCSAGPPASSRPRPSPRRWRGTGVRPTAPEAACGAYFVAADIVGQRCLWPASTWNAASVSRRQLAAECRYPSCDSQMASDGSWSMWIASGLPSNGLIRLARGSIPRAGQTHGRRSRPYPLVFSPCGGKGLVLRCFSSLVRCFTQHL